MIASEQSIWFVGDLGDPWVVSIADALPRSACRLACSGDWPDGLLDDIPVPATVVLHRAQLGSRDAERLARLRKERAGALWVVLCVGPHARYVDLARWSPLADVVLPEATASETIARHVAGAGGEGRGGPSAGRTHSARPCIDVVSTNYELRETLAEICHAAGYPTRKGADWLELAPVSGSLAVWDVPVLEADWGRALARRSESGGVVALIGFADRAQVAQARAHGALACLDLPCDPADLIDVLERVSASRCDRNHEVPPPPRVLRRGQKVVVEPGSGAYN